MICQDVRVRSELIAWTTFSCSLAEHAHSLLPLKFNNNDPYHMRIRARPRDPHPTHPTSAKIATLETFTVVLLERLSDFTYMAFRCSHSLCHHHQRRYDRVKLISLLTSGMVFSSSLGNFA